MKSCAANLRGQAAVLARHQVHDYSVIQLASTRQNFDRLWEIFTDLALNPAFTEQDIDRVREQILTGLREQETNPDNYLEILQDRVIYANHPYANESDGTIETISKFTAEDLRAYHQKMMQTSQLLLVFVGDLDAEDLKKRITETFGKLPRGNYKETALPDARFFKTDARCYFAQLCRPITCGRF